MALSAYRLTASPIYASATDIDYMAQHHRTQSYPPQGYADGSASPSPPSDYPYSSNRGYSSRSGYYQPPIAPAPDRYSYRSSSGDYPPQSSYSPPPYSPSSGHSYSNNSNGYRHSPPPGPPPSRGGPFIPTPSDAYANRPPRPASAMQQHSHRPYPTGHPLPHSHRHASGTGTTQRKSSSSSQSLSHSSERYPCELCGKDFSRAHDRKRHFETQHASVPTLHKCRYCEKDFSRADSLKRHLQNGCDEAPQ